MPLQEVSQLAETSSKDPCQLEVLRRRRGRVLLYDCVVPMYHNVVCDGCGEQSVCDFNSEACWLAKRIGDSIAAYCKLSLFASLWSRRRLFKWKPHQFKWRVVQVIDHLLNRLTSPWLDVSVTGFSIQDVAVDEWTLNIVVLRSWICRLKTVKTVLFLAGERCSSRGALG